MNKIHTKIRQNFGLFGGLSIIFGIIATMLFYKTGIGLNSFLFTATMILILVIISKKLKITVTKGTYLCFLGAILLGLSNVLTSNEYLQFLNSIGILLLLDYSLNRLFSTKKSLSFIENLKKIFKLPFKALSSIGMLFVDGNRFIKDKKLIKNERLRNIFIGCLIAIPLMLIIIALLSSADIVFARLTLSLFEWLLYRDFYLIILMILLATLFCYSLLCAASKDNEASPEDKTKANSTIGITVSTLLLFVYLLFCGIQILYLFSGGLFSLPAEYTYAEYARAGFFELLTVTCLNIVFILACENIFNENKWLNAIMTAITGCTYIMIASATYRMCLYIGAYQLTFLRLLVLLFLLIDALLLLGVIISIYKKKFPLFEYSVVVISLCYILFSYSKPDYYIARCFIANVQELQEEDLEFLTRQLSYDAAPVVAPLLEGPYEYNSQSIIGRYYKKAADKSYSWDIREYNNSNQRAIKLMKQHSSFN
ncbi:MAG: DUF4173 domain-containing protein [Clostridiales bacterium]|nr:DUF4173 domain-containing protein [Clostridiales bacterium]